jgi:hypothetical protein
MKHLAGVSTTPRSRCERCSTHTLATALTSGATSPRSMRLRLGRQCGGWTRRSARLVKAVVRRGEVWWAEHPEWGRRPALVMTR